MSLAAAEQSVREGDLDGALRHLQDQIRKEPARADLRIFLFQLLCVLGQWDRALTQLAVAGELDAGALAMVHMYRDVIACEKARAAVFAGRTSPLIFGEPDEWLALLAEALTLDGSPRAVDAQALRARAFEAAPARAGSVDGSPFEWIADGDMRLGPVCEAIINGRYYWVPFMRIGRLVIEAPTDLRDLVWVPAQFHFANGGEAVGVIPTRYSGSEDVEDAAIRLSRKTSWRELTPDVFAGLGQRVLTTDQGESPLLDTRTITFGPEGDSEPRQADHG